MEGFAGATEIMRSLRSRLTTRCPFTGATYQVLRPGRTSRCTFIADGGCTPAQYHPRVLWQSIWPKLKHQLSNGMLPPEMITKLSQATCTDPAIVTAEVTRRVGIDRLKAVMEAAKLEQRNSGQ